MRAVRVPELGGIDAGDVLDVTPPKPGPGEVLLAVEAAPVNFVDLVTITGRYQFRPELPYTPGKGPAGTVLEVGDGVASVTLGDRVLAMAEYGGYAEQAVVDHQQVYRLPDGVSCVDAAAMAVAFDTAWMALRERARLEPGESVLVLGGTGAVGYAAIELARAMGAGRVLATASSPERVPVQLRDDPDAVVDLSLGAPRDSVREQVARATGGGVDVVIDTLGGDPFDGAIRSLAWRGRLVTVGYAAGRIPTLKVNYLLLKNIEVSGIQISDYRRRRPDLVAAAFEEIFDLTVRGSIAPPPRTTFPLERWQEPLRLLEARSARERLVLTPCEPAS